MKWQAGKKDEGLIVENRDGGGYHGTRPGPAFLNAASSNGAACNGVTRSPVNASHNIA